MKRLWLLVAFLFPSFTAIAQYAGPGVDACLKYAQADTRQYGNKPAKVIIDRDAHLTIEKYTRKAGSQFVSSILTGNGAIAFERGVSVEMSFVCLLASDRQAVFFYWLPRQEASSLTQCKRGPDAAECLDALQQVADQDLTALYAQHYVEARETDAKAGNENASNAFRRAGDAWKAYRDVECALRGGGQATKACLVDLTRRRALDLR
ncbi:MAG TPA: lysozyme inhibitor LprI family protein [Burkholderiales bacterium]|jgi:uncharacterized protein YecT (DUF1311 family)|nr:lysozyme inhibitor LprI family protein [Burkholderiales bacterium]